MAVTVETTPVFDGDFKRFAKKFKSLKTEILAFEDELIKNPEMGTSLGGGLYKARLASKDKGGGESGGFRVITYLVYREDNDTVVNLLTMYDKSEDATIKTKDLKKLVTAIFGK